jgi:hypothetical protein
VAIVATDKGWAVAIDLITGAEVRNGNSQVHSSLSIVA